MPVAKVIEIIAEGKTIEDAMHNALNEAKKSIRGIKSIDVEHIHAKVKEDKISALRVVTKISFVVE